MFAAVCSAPEIHVSHEYFKILSSFSPQACASKGRVQDPSLRLCSGDESVCVFVSFVGERGMYCGVYVSVLVQGVAG